MADSTSMRPVLLRAMADELSGVRHGVDQVAAMVDGAQVTAQQCGDATAATAINEFVAVCRTGLLRQGARVQDITDRIKVAVTVTVDADEQAGADLHQVARMVPGGVTRMVP